MNANQINTAAESNTNGNADNTLFVTETQSSTSDLTGATMTTLDVTPIADAPAAVVATEAKKPSKVIKIERKDLTQAYLKEALRLDEETGYFYWLRESRVYMIGDFAGSIRPADGYYSLTIAGTIYSGAQLKAFYTTGLWLERAPAKEKVEAKPRVARGVPIITEEMKAAAIIAEKEKKAALKLKHAEAEAASKLAAAPGDPKAQPDATAPVKNFEALPESEGVSIEANNTVTQIDDSDF